MKKYKIKENNFNLVSKLFIAFKEDGKEDIEMFDVHYIGSSDHLEDISRYFLSWFPIKILGDCTRPLGPKYKTIFLT